MFLTRRGLLQNVVLQNMMCSKISMNRDVDLHGEIWCRDVALFTLIGISKYMERKIESLKLTLLNTVSQ